MIRCGHCKGQHATPDDVLACGVARNAAAKRSTESDQQVRTTTPPAEYPHDPRIPYDEARTYRPPPKPTKKKSTARPRPTSAPKPVLGGAAGPGSTRTGGAAGSRSTYASGTAHNPGYPEAVIRVRCQDCKGWILDGEDHRCHP